MIDRIHSRMSSIIKWILINVMKNLQNNISSFLIVADEILEKYYNKI